MSIVTPGPDGELELSTVIIDRKRYFVSQHIPEEFYQEDPAGARGLVVTWVKKELEQHGCDLDTFIILADCEQHEDLAADRRHWWQKKTWIILRWFYQEPPVPIIYYLFAAWAWQKITYNGVEYKVPDNRRSIVIPEVNQ